MESNQAEQRPRSEDEGLLESTRGEGTARWLAVLALFVAMVALCSPYLFRERTVPAEGEEISEPLIASVGFRSESPELRATWEQERRGRHDQIYSYDGRIKAAALRRLATILAAARASAPPEMSIEDARANLSAIDPAMGSWSAEQQDQLLALGGNESFRLALEGIINSTYNSQFVVENKTSFLAHRQRGVARVLSVDERAPSQEIRDDLLLGYPGEYRAMVEVGLREQLGALLAEDRASFDVGLKLIMLVSRPNLVYDADRSRESYERFPTRDFFREYRSGEPLIDAERGQPHRVNAREAAIAVDHAAAARTESLARLGGHVGYVALVFALVGFYVRKFDANFRFTAREILLLGLPIVLALSTSFFFIALGASRELLSAGLFPAGAVGMIGALVLGPRLALLLVTWSCLLYGLQADMDFAVVVVSLFGGYTAVAALRRIRERREVLTAGLLIAIVNALVILLLDFIGSGSAMRAEETSTRILVGAVAGFSCALIAISALPMLEVAFDVTTDLRLLELSGLEHPLLARLEEEAPGTWQHTLNVAKLAEAAAGAIDANVLLVRAGVYFHDVGKLSKPEYFTENQVTLEDKARHVTLKPQISTLIIKNHVKEGIELARKAGLPQRIVDFIPQHHGSGLIQFFYQKALGQVQSGQSKEIVREEDYRYPGPKPQTIEAAIAMMADSVEATSTAKFATRTVREDEVQQLVRAIVSDRFNDGQFDQCSLTMEDLTKIRESLVKTLLSRYHSRVDYPKLERPGGAAPTSSPALAARR